MNVLRAQFLNDLVLFVCKQADSRCKCRWLFV